MFKRAFFGLVAAVLISLPVQSVWAQSSVSLSDVATVSLLPGWRTQQGTHMAAIRIELNAGWKTYWRAPGDAGIPPQFNWEGSANLGSVQMYWPTPTVFMLNGMQTLAYENEVVIPIELTPRNDSQSAIKIRGRMEFGVCEEVCVPMSVSIRADLNNSGIPNPAIKQALLDLPMSAKAAGVGAVVCQVEPISDGLRVTANLELPEMGKQEVAVIELPDKSIWVSEAATARQGGRLSTTAEMVPANGQPFALSRSDIRITVFGDGRAVNIQGCTAG